MSRRVIASLLAAFMTTGAWAQCEPIGWVLVQQKQISVSERVCVYEKNGARISIMVSTAFCPLSPC